MKTIDKNNENKSILYTNGDELVVVVFKILEEVMDCSLTDFDDKKKEDFLIKMDGVTFIGEIKGINSNVKAGNLSQLDNHFHNYVDGLREQYEIENVKSLLIINHQRSRHINDREPVHQTQIDLAIRNGSLIIETDTLLAIFEQFKSGNITSEQIITKFTEEVGILKL